LTTTFIVFLFGFITNPLKSLSKEMDLASTQNHFTPVPSKREDELGILQRSFYRMLERIRENEKERERTQKNLFLTEKMVAIGKLTAGMAHEINNPLGGILNCIYHFKKGIPSPERQREYLDLMEDGIKRIQKTVTNLLEYARNRNPERSPVQIAPLIEKALALLDYQIRKNRISIEQDISANLPAIQVDRDQMGQVLVNILLNAIQAMEQGGILTVNARNIAEKLLITVSDTGGGIPDDVLPSVFDPFFTTKGEGKGTGLGLWISQGMIERHGGTIQVLSKEAKGTTVEIQLPMQSTQERGL
jgi:signal transduction histidine kinase